MTLRGSIFLAMVTGLLSAGVPATGRAADTNAPDFQEVYRLLRAHLPGATDAGLNEAAVTGLLAELKGRASLSGDSAAPATNVIVVRPALLADPSVSYLRVVRVTEALAAQINKVMTQGFAMADNDPLLPPPAWTNRLSGGSFGTLTGTVVDLRFASGDAYTSVGAVVTELTVQKLPLLVLINGETSGAAEVLAAKLRAAGALLIGNPTAGLAMMTEDFPLANGQRLRVGTTPIKLNGVEMAALTPDIPVPAGLAEERAWMENPYGPATPAGGTPGTGTNSFIPLLDHTTEADLVRQKRKDGEGPVAVNPGPAARAEAAPPVLRDAVLVRALDLTRALAVLKTPGR